MRTTRFLLAIALVGLVAPPVADAGGWAVYQTEIRDDNLHEILGPGTVEVDDDAGVSFRLLSADSAGNFKANSSSNFTYGIGGAKNCSQQVLSGTDSVFELCLQTNGSFTIQRTGTMNHAIDIVLRVMWINKPAP